MLSARSTRVFLVDCQSAHLLIHSLLSILLFALVKKHLVRVVHWWLSSYARLSSLNGFVVVNDVGSHLSSASSRLLMWHRRCPLELVVRKPVVLHVPAIYVTLHGCLHRMMNATNLSFTRAIGTPPISRIHHVVSQKGSGL